MSTEVDRVFGWAGLIYPRVVTVLAVGGTGGQKHMEDKFHRINSGHISNDRAQNFKHFGI